MTKSWKKLEDHVRGIASLRWNAICKAEHLDGVDFDAIVHISSDELVIIEISEERTLEKVRTDINKIAPTKLRLATSGVLCRAFIVLAEQPTLSMIEAGKASHISVLSATDFEKALFDFQGYNSLREDLPFGSAVDAKTGENDPRTFIPVRYETVGSRNDMSIDDIVSNLLRGNRIILTGDYGTGKSRCIREVYSKLAKLTLEAGSFPIAINLRDHWSSSNALEVIAGHLGNIGLASSIDNVIRLLNSGHLTLLLDGFDEIGAQSYDVRVDDRKGLRKHAVRGIRDLLLKSKHGALITGRSHFFDSDEEMTQALGLGSQSSNTISIRAPEAFTQEEGKSYLQSLGVSVEIPEWLPRKPLVFQVLVELYPNDVKRIFSREHGQFEFWGAFINAVCVRESRGVSDSIAPQTIKMILLELAGRSRFGDSFLGRLSPRDIDEAYESIVGSTPDQTGRQLLSRMCALGRIEPESPDRQFIDYNLVDVLRSEKLITEIIALTDRDTKVQWKQSLRYIGAVHAASIVRTFDLESLCFTYLKKFGNCGNTRKLGEIISILCSLGSGRLDFQGLQLINSEIPILNATDHVIENLTIKNSIINILLLDGTAIKQESALQIENSIVCLATGVSAATGLPSWISNCEVIEFERVTNSSKIKDSPLSPPHKLLLSIVHKIFFQPGSGREEGSLLKGGYGQRYNPKLVDGIIKILIREGLVTKRKGDDGWIYQPERSHTERMNRLRSELTLSDDSIWHEVSQLRS